MTGYDGFPLVKVPLPPSNEMLWPVIDTIQYVGPRDTLSILLTKKYTGKYLHLPLCQISPHFRCHVTSKSTTQFFCLRYLPSELLKGHVCLHQPKNAGRPATADWGSALVLFPES